MASGESRDLYSLASSFVQVTSDHRDKFKSFIHVYDKVRDALYVCEKTLLKIAESRDSEFEPAGLLCRSFAEQVHVLVTSLRDDSLDEMKRMKDVAKQKLKSFDSELKGNFRDIRSLCSELDRLEIGFSKAQAGARIVHAQALDGDQSHVATKSQCWKLMSKKSGKSGGSRDELFDKLQRINVEREHIANESNRVYCEFINRHSAAYNSLTQTVEELSSMRRRMNRKVVAELKAISATTSGDESKSLCMHANSPLLHKIESAYPANSDFGMSLPDPGASIHYLIGKDRCLRIRSMITTTDSDIIEYRAVQSYIAREEGELTFSRNEKIEIINKEPSGWWTGRNMKREEGIFPCVLVAQRPAGAPLPLSATSIQHAVNNMSHRPKIYQDRIDGTWKTIGDDDDRVDLIKSSPEKCFIGIIHFSHFSPEICVEVNDIVDIIQVDGKKTLLVENMRGQRGSVPLSILTLKRRTDHELNTDNKENNSLLIN